MTLNAETRFTNKLKKSKYKLKPYVEVGDILKLNGSKMFTGKFL